jgi:hypothetical protein
MGHAIRTAPPQSHAMLVTVAEVLSAKIDVHQQDPEAQIHVDVVESNTHGVDSAIAHITSFDG